MNLRETHRLQFENRAPARTLDVIEHLFEKPVVTSRQLTERYAISQSSAQTVIRFLEGDGMLRDTTGRKRDRVNLADAVAAIVSE